MSKRDPNFEQFTTDIRHLARAHTREQADMLLAALCETELWYGVDKDEFDDNVGDLDEYDPQRDVRTFFKNYCRGDWFSWFVGSPKYPLQKPDANTIEGWHLHGVQHEILKVPKAATPMVLNYVLPKILRVQSEKAQQEQGVFACENVNIMSQVGRLHVS